MGLFQRSEVHSGPQSGERYEGDVTWCHDFELVPWTGYYGVGSDGPDPNMRLKLVVEDDGTHYFEVM